MKKEIELSARSCSRITVGSVIGNNETECMYSSRNSKGFARFDTDVHAEKFSRNREVATAVQFLVSMFISRIVFNTVLKMFLAEKSVNEL